MWIFNGNVNELGDIGRNPGKSYLFSLTVYNPEISLSGARVQFYRVLEQRVRVCITVWLEN
jgi:hypothetical protein